MLNKILHYIASHLKEIASLFAALGITIPLMIAVIEYKEKAKIQEDKNFREIIEKLSSKDVDTRTAAATSMGTFIGKGGKFEDVIIVNELPFIKKRSKYEHEAINILKNRLLIETEYSVSNAIRGSLLNFKDEKKLIQDLLKIEHFNLNKLNVVKEQSILTHSQDGVLDSTIKEQYIRELVNKYNFIVNSMIVSDLVGACLQMLSGGDTVVTGLQFFQNSLNKCALVNCKLRHLYMSYSSISNATIDTCKFDSSFITNSEFISTSIYRTTFVHDTINECVFDWSSLISVSFNGSKFRNVFFIGTDVTDTDFRGVKGLQLENFYGAQNLDKAKFDSAFKKLLFDSLKYIDAEDVKKFAYSRPELLITKYAIIKYDADSIQKELKNSK